jgi:cyanophycinase
MAATLHRYLLIIGGAEDKVGRATVLRRFVRLAGGRNARIVVIPSASSFPDEAVGTYNAIFGRLGAPRVVVIDPSSRPAAVGGGAAVQAMVQAMDDATGVFMTGGNQLKLSQLFVGTPLADAISRAHERGAVVAGTSAGASIMSQFMISLGADGVTPRQRTSQLTSGLGLLPGVIIDQHFDERARYGPEPSRHGHRRRHGRRGPGRPQADGGGLRRGLRRRCAKGRQRRPSGTQACSPADLRRGGSLATRRRNVRPSHGTADRVRREAP